ncbi:MAG: hypothetical protein VKN83_00270 [Cyanobacteriota bacterium]|jgi:uncharacterized protein YceH (UPF0502 family)|nr:hypothetical protein [Cyanobacteriota bacterium]
MSTPQSLLQATINRLSARLGSQLADRVAELAVLAQDAPQRLQQEFTLFWEEVEQEARRLDHGDSAPAATESSAPSRDPQDQIDALRAQVASLSRKLEVPLGGGGQTGSV